MNKKLAHISIILLVLALVTLACGIGGKEEEQAAEATAPPSVPLG